MRGWLVIVFLCFNPAFTQSELDEEKGLSVGEVVKKYGYPFEVHAEVETDDGYLLDVYRIPYGKENTNATRPAVLIMHGLTGSSRNWVAMGPKRGLAFVLADNGFDVWMGNTRGTAASRKHRTLNPDLNVTFWDFSWHEIGYYDTPAIFDRIHNVTKLESISYIGHSQGTTTFYVFASTRPEYNKNVTVAISFGPQAYMKHIYSPWVRWNAVLGPLGEELVKLTRMHEQPLRPFDGFMNLQLQLICTLEIFQPLCAHFFFAAGGYSPSQLQMKDLPRLVVGFPNFAARQGFHYAQNINSGKFRRYDYGEEQNLARYGTVEPPAYNLSKITSPQALYYGSGDWFVGKKDVIRFCEEVRNCAYAYKVPDRRFSHYDYIFAKDIVKLVFNDVVKTLNKFNYNCKNIKAC